MELEKKINVGHLLVAGSFLVAAIFYTVDIKTAISDEGHARETADQVFSERMENISRILNDIDARTRLNDVHRITDEARSEWDD